MESHLTLYKDGEIVETEDGADFLGKESIKLEFVVPANCDSTANYTCLAVSRAGQERAHAKLNVLCK